VLEQIAKERNAAEQWDLRNSYVVLRLNYTANHDCTAIRNSTCVVACCVFSVGSIVNRLRG